MSKHTFLAFDLGADSGRTILGAFEGGRLQLEVVTRFSNPFLVLGKHWHWNIFRLFEKMKSGLAASMKRNPEGLGSLGIDTWGVDFGFLAEDGSILSLPHAYRDPHIEGAIEEFSRVIPRHRIYELTGIQFLPFNSLFQLYALKKAGSSVLEAARDLLFMPDLFNFLLTGRKATEFTIATTSQLYDPRQGGWAADLFRGLGVSSALMQEPVPPGTPLGLLDGGLAREIGITPVPVVAVASHDTASAVAAVPAEGEDWAYISSGTWSLMGVELKHPVISRRGLEMNFTNEGGIAGTFRFLKNITGLWLLQECQKNWARDRSIGYEELTLASMRSKPFQSLIDPDWTGFLNPPDMPSAIRRFCRTTEQDEPSTAPEFARCIFESLALKYRFVLDQLREVLPMPIRRIHIIGGGSQNSVLSQFAANALGLPVISGPVEATAAGNILVQALSRNLVESHAHMRKVIMDSFTPNRYQPEQSQEWEKAYSRFQGIVEGSKGLESY